MFYVLQIIMSVLTGSFFCRDYLHTKELVVGGKLVLSWVVEEEMFFFKLSSMKKGYVGLAFSYSDLPLDGFLAGVGSDGDQYVLDLHLDYADPVNEVFHLVPDSEMNVNIDLATENDTLTVIEGSKNLNNCEDRVEDISLTGDVLKLFYMIGSTAIDDSFKVLVVDLKKPSKYGQTFITLYTTVQHNLDTLEQFSSSSYRLDLTRPDSRGDAKCKVFKGRSSAKFYTGFVPLLKGYNGENGLIRRMTVYQCDPPASSHLAEQFADDTLDCYDGDFLPYSFCKSILFIWTPGSEGEIMEDGKGMEAVRDRKRKNFFLLQVIYNAGTGFLSDDSGMQLYYTRKDREPAGKMVVGHRQSNKLIIMPGVEGWKTSGLCSHRCLARGGVERINISSVSLVAGPGAKNVRLVAVQARKTIVSGFRSDYQPVRILDSQYGVDTSEESVVVECTYRSHGHMVRGVMGEEGSEECFAVITYSPKMDIVECVSEPDRSSLESSYGLEYFRYNSAMEDFKETWNNFTDTEKKGVNIKSYNNSFAIFCTKNDLKKIAESGIEAPKMEEENKKNVCEKPYEIERRGVVFGAAHQISENGFRKMIRNSRLLSLTNEINFDEVYNSFCVRIPSYSYNVIIGVCISCALV